MESSFIGSQFELIELPQLYCGNPAVTLGKKYLIKDVDGSNFIINDDNNESCSIGSSHFNISMKYNLSMLEQYHRKRWDWKGIERMYSCADGTDCPDLLKIIHHLEEQNKILLSKIKGPC